MLCRGRSGMDQWKKTRNPANLAVVAQDVMVHPRPRSREAVSNVLQARLEARIAFGRTQIWVPEHQELRLEVCSPKR